MKIIVQLRKNSRPRIVSRGLSPERAIQIYLSLFREAAMGRLWAVWMREV